MAQGLVGGLVGGIVAGSVGEVAGALLGAAKPLYEDAAEEARWHARAYLSGPPGNHDLERALHAAWLTGVLAVLRQHEVALLGERAPRPGSLRDRYDRLRRGLAKVLDRDIPDPAHLEIWHVRDWCHQQLDQLGTLAEEEDASVLGTLEAALTPGFAAPGAAGDPRIAAARDLAWQRLAEGVGARGVRLPASFKARFDSTERAAPGWFACFFAYVQDALKENGKVRTAFFARQSAVIREFVARMDAALARVAEDTSATRRNTEALLAGQGGTDAKLDRLLALAEQGGAFARAQDAGISEAAVRRIVEKLGAQGLGPEDLLPWLDNWIDSAREQLARHINEDAAFAAAMEEANRRFRAGRGDEASAALMAEFDREERAEKARQEERKRRRLRLLEEAIRYDELALNAPAAVAKLRVMAGIEGATTADARGDWLHEQASRYQERGAQKGENAALLIAIAAWQATLEERTRERVPLGWATTQNNLGNALLTLGAREAGTARLEEAVAAYRAALEEWTRDRVPLDWAATQNNLGIALRTLGEREAGTARLEEAVAAYRAALEERTRERVPLQWATTQNNLGNALWPLGAREAGTARLEEAVAAYRAALEERTRERVPLQWAMSQHTLANGLAALAERRADRAALLWKAIAHMRNAVAGYRQVGDAYWGPIAERRLGELEAMPAAQ